mmetsp:Transcript_33129/g.78271  ORF Transcript_33129/g.78271 Transcript_33129/m.78271 type:complete len:291 (-) Transcript_33129:285-1157(-)
MEQSTSTKSAQQTGLYKVPGDVINLFVLVGSFAYIWTVVYFTQPGIEGVLDEDWKKDGFCIQNKDVPFWSSFDTCLYLDVLLSVVLGMMYVSWKDTPGMETSSTLVPSLIAATVGHGLAHGFMAMKFRDESYEADTDEHRGSSDEDQLWHLVAFCVFFFFPLLKAAMPRMSNQNLLLCAAVATYGKRFVKEELGFGYIQTIVNVAFSVSQLMSPEDEKSKREYFFLPLSGVLPLVVAWNEALFCEAYFRSIGGHTLYDVSIIISFIVFYADCFRFHKKSNMSGSMKEKTM